MTQRLSGKKAIVTGGSRGIGAAIAERFASEGADVAITYQNNQEAADRVVATLTAAGRRGLAIQADAADPRRTAAAIGEAAEALGGLDLLVHNAGTFGIASTDDDGYAEYRRMFGTNVDGVVAGTNAAVGRLSDGGRIIVIGSISAHTTPLPGSGAYGASKAAVAGLVRGWARDLAPRGILVNVIQPGPIATDMNPADGEIAAFLTDLIPIGRYGRPEEVAALATFLASDESSFITGSAIDIDGGMTV